MFMCKDHWSRLPRHHQQAIYANYVPGQEKRKDPSPQYMLAQKEAILAMGIIDGVDAGALKITRGWIDYWKKIAAEAGAA